MSLESLRELVDHLEDMANRLGWNPEMTEVKIYVESGKPRKAVMEYTVDAKVDEFRVVLP